MLCCAPGEYACEDAPLCCPGHDYHACDNAPDGSTICSASLYVWTLVPEAAAAADSALQRHTAQQMAAQRCTAVERGDGMMVIKECLPVGTSASLRRHYAARSAAIVDAGVRLAYEWSHVSKLCRSQATTAAPQTAAAATAPQAASARSQAASSEEAASAASEALGARHLRCPSPAKCALMPYADQAPYGLRCDCAPTTKFLFEHSFTR